MSRATILFRGTGGGAVSDDAPVGTVSNQQIISGNNKWIECDGSLVAVTQYPELAAALDGVTPAAPAGFVYLPESNAGRELVVGSKVRIKALP